MMFYREGGQKELSIDLEFPRERIHQCIAL